MNKLTGEQIEFIRQNLEKKPSSRSFLFNEYVDHICCDIENRMEKGRSFEEAFRQVTGAMSDREIKLAHNETIHLLNAKFVFIKKILYLSAILFILSWIINLPGISGWTGLFSFIILGIVYLRIGYDFLREVRIARINVLLSFLGFLSFPGTVLGYILLFLNRNYGIDTRGHGADAMVFGWLSFSILCLVYFIRDYNISIDRSSRKRNMVFTWLSALNILLAGLTVASFPLFQKVGDYLFYFILLILAIDLACLIWLAAKRYFKYILIVALFTGSLMLVFIHSNIRNKLPGGQPAMHTISVNISPAEKKDRQTIYLYFYYDRHPHHTFTVPMRLSPAGYYTNAWPSYPYKGYLVYKTGNDSIDAGRAFSHLPVRADSIYLNIPKIKEYTIDQ